MRLIRLLHKALDVEYSAKLSVFYMQLSYLPRLRVANLILCA